MPLYEQKFGLLEVVLAGAMSRLHLIMKHNNGDASKEEMQAQTTKAAMMSNYLVRH